VIQDELGGWPNARVTLLLTGRQPVILGSTETDPANALADLDGYAPRLPTHSAAAALSLALDMAGESGEVAYLTDHLPPENEREPRVAYVAVGTPIENVAFVGAEWTPPRSTVKGQLFLRIANFARETRTIPLVGTVRDREVVRKSLVIAPGSEKRFACAAPTGAETVAFTLPDDALALDNHAVLARPPRKVVTVRNLFPAGPLRDHVDRALRAIEDARPLDAGAGHVAIGPPQAFSIPAPKTWWLVAGPLTAPYRGEGEAVNVVGPFLMERTHPLLDSVTLAGVICPGAAPAQATLSPIVSCGALPLIAVLPTTRSKVYWLNVDLARSNLTRAPDWPILLHNLLELRRQALPGLDRKNFRLGDVVHYERPDPDSALTVVAPNDDSAEHAAAPSLYLPALREQGIYRIEKAGVVVDRFAVNLLDDRESDLRDHTTARVEPQRAPVAAQLVFGQRPPWLVFLLGSLVLAALLGTWWLGTREATL